MSCVQSEKITLKLKNPCRELGRLPRGSCLRKKPSVFCLADSSDPSELQSGGTAFPQPALLPGLARVLTTTGCFFGRSCQFF